MLRTLATVTVLLALTGLGSAQTWTPLTHQPGAAVGPMFLLRDGRVLVHEEQQGDPTAWHILTPDAQGSYINGTWSDGGHLPSTYAPFFFGNAVLLDGKTVVIEGGEYNHGSAVWTTLGAVGTMSGSTFTWALNSPPSGWSTLGDAQSVTLADGRYMQANCCTKQSAYYNGPNSWTPGGSVLSSRNDEQGWTLLGNGKVLTVDATPAPSCGGTGKSSELYDPTTNTWGCGPDTPVQLYNSQDQELGAAVLMYNGKVLQFGGLPSATAIYDPVANTWTAGPTPTGFNQADGPAALEPNGKVLAMLSPGLFQGGCKMVEYDPTSGTLSNTTNPQNCPSDPSFVGHLMTLPTGQIMFTDLSGRVEIYTPTSGVAANAVPVIQPTNNTANVKALRNGSANNLIRVQNLNGLSQASSYGDDYSPETNYPIIRLKSSSTGNVYYARTHDESTHSIAPGTIGNTMYDLPTVPTGLYTLVVVANGIPSAPQSVRIQ